MNITTKTGDKGFTFLYSGQKVPKDHIRIEICGILDELSSYLAMAGSLIRKKNAGKLLAAIQKDLYLIAAEIVTQARSLRRLKKRLEPDSVRAIEEYIKGLEGAIKIEKGCLYYCGHNLISSIFDVARAIARRAERRVTALKRRNLLKNSSILVYLNRLSDLLFLLARRYEKKTT